MVWSPLAGGFLSGKFGRDQAGERRRPARRVRLPARRQGDAPTLLDVLREVAEARGVGGARRARVAAAPAGRDQRHHRREEAEQLATTWRHRAALSPERAGPPGRAPAGCRRVSRLDAGPPGRGADKAARRRAATRPDAGADNVRQRKKVSSLPARRRGSAPRRCACMRTAAGTSSSTFRATRRRRKRSPASAARSAPKRSWCAPMSRRCRVPSPRRRSRAALGPRRRARQQCRHTKFVAPGDLDGLDAGDFQRIYGVNVVGAYQIVRALAPMLGRARGRGRQRLLDRLDHGHRLFAGVHGKQGRAQCAHRRPRARARPAGARQRDRAGPGRDALDAAGARRRALRAAVQGYRARAALDAVVTPEDVAEAAWFLGASAAKTTGEVLLLDGGLRLTRG